MKTSEAFMPQWAPEDSLASPEHDSSGMNILGSNNQRVNFMLHNTDQFLCFCLVSLLLKFIPVCALEIVHMQVREALYLYDIPTEKV